MAPGTFAFQGTIQFKVGDLLDIGGTVVITRQPNGTLDLGLVGASVKVKVAGTEVFAISGTALFSISPLTGFRMQSFKVTGFSILGGIGLPVPTAPTPTGTNGTPATGLLPTADLASPFNGGKVVASDLSLNKYIDVQFTDRSGNGLKESTILDVEQEFDILVGGAPLAGLTVNGTPEKLANKVGVYRYRLLGTFAFPATGVVTVQFRANAFSDLSGAGGTGVPNVPETEQFYLVAAATGPGSIPPPIAVLASPGNGESLTAVDLNARGYIDVTYTSLDGKPILKSSIAQNAKFSITGSGVTADLQRDATTNVPVLVGTPLLIAGTAFDATSVTYRYFLRDVNNRNTVGLFQPGEVTIEFLRNDTTQTYFATSANPAPAAGETPASNATTPATRNAAGVRQTFTLSPTAPGAAPTTAPLAIGPLTLLGPRIGIADVGFKDGMLVLTIAIGVDRASLGFNKPAAPNSGATTTPTTQQNSSGVTVDLIGVLGTFDLQVDALGLLSGNFRVNVPGKFALRVSSLEAEDPERREAHRRGHRGLPRPEGGAAQELVKINSATLLMPPLQHPRHDPPVRHRARPERPGHRPDERRDPRPRRARQRLHDRQRRARLRRRPAAPRHGPAPARAGGPEDHVRLDPRARGHPRRHQQPVGHRRHGRRLQRLDLRRFRRRQVPARAPVLGDDHGPQHRRRQERRRDAERRGDPPAAHVLGRQGRLVPVQGRHDEHHARQPGVTESARELARRGVALRHVALERPQHRAATASRGLGVVGGRRQRALVLAADRELGEGRALAGQAAGEHLVDDDAERVDVGAGRRLLAARLLGREVGGGADDRSDLGQAGLLGGAGDAEVGRA